MRYRYSVTIFRKVALIDSNMRFTHRWKRVGKLYTTTKADAVRYLKAKCFESWYKATLRKED